jgi:hypothetical protein
MSKFFGKNVRDWVKKDNFEAGRWEDKKTGL